MKKRGQSISFNAIIIAALGIFVLIVLLMIFSGRMNIFARSTECAARGGGCISRHPEWNGGCPPEKPVSIMTQDCPLVGESQGKYPGQCCIAIG